MGREMYDFIPSERNGFTIVAIVVVLIIVGLLAGGVMVGKSLIRSAELQSVLADVSRFKSAAKLFRDKYHYLPGDLPTAEGFWGAMPGCPDTAPSIERTQQTCNGNGDGFVARSVGPLQIEENRMEALRTWQHLANAGLLEGQFTGTGSPAADNGLDPGLNIPKSKVAQSGYTFHFSAPIQPGVSWVFPSKYGHIIVFGRTAGYVDAAMTGINGLFIDTPAFLPAISSEDALRIDRLVDDGKPATGHVLAHAPGTPSEGGEWHNCATTDLPLSAEYNTDPATYVADSVGEVSAITCSLIFITGL